MVAGGAVGFRRTWSCLFFDESWPANDGAGVGGGQGRRLVADCGRPSSHQERSQARDLRFYGGTTSTSYIRFPPRPATPHLHSTVPSRAACFPPPLDPSHRTRIASRSVLVAAHFFISTTGGLWRGQGRQLGGERGLGEAHGGTSEQVVNIT